jgi:hypothetical protein
VLTGIAAAVFAVGGLWRFRRSFSEPQKRPLCVALLAFAIGALFDTGAASPFDRTVGVLNLADFLAHAFGLVGVYFLLLSLDGLVGTKRRNASKWLGGFLVAGLLGSAALFFSTRMTVETSAFTAQYGRQPTIVGYWAISIVFPVLCLVELGRTVLTHWSSPHPALRRGLRVTGVGVVLGFAYAALKFAELVTAKDGVHSLAATDGRTDRMLLGSGLLFIAAGLVLPSLVMWLRPWRDRMRIRRSLRELDWLWTQFCAKARAADFISEGPADFLLLRRVVELRDAQATLWDYLSVADVDQIRRELSRESEHEPSGPQIEAAGLALALRRELEVMPRGRGAGEPRAPRAVLGAPGRPLNLRAEIAELAALGQLVKGAAR